MTMREYQHNDQPRPRRIVDDDLEPPVYVDDATSQTEEEEVADRRVRPTYLDSVPTRINAVLAVLLLVLEALLGLRFVLVAFGANRSAGFVNFVHNVSWPFVRPFEHAFRHHVWSQGVIEPETLLAMAVYLLLFLLAALLVNALLPNSEERDAAVINRHRYMRG